MNPEQKARKEIDRQLDACGWQVQDHKAMNIIAALGVAVREFPLKTGFADYLLYVDGKVIGVIEAKPEGHTLTSVEIQSSKYTLGLPDGIPHYCKPLPFAYESTSAVTQFSNSLEPDFRSRTAFTFHWPDYANFGTIVIEERHRSVYDVRRKLLKYFNVLLNIPTYFGVRQCY